ncbi:MAG: 4Fe-4S dicluster domain-containing protein, partial [Clostridiales bacterium]|nr:4Fe-4S dicluster domain-containing protein [Clostridiales bacterium]
CRCLCPFKLDVRSFTGKAARGNFDSAYREYRNTVIFPAVVSRICDAPCGAACVRGRNGEAAVSLRGLEAACLANSRDRKTVRYDLPSKKDRIAIIGAGPSGLACAVKLAARGFPVTVFLKETEPGGSLRDSAARDVYREEIARETADLPIEYRAGTAVNAIEPIFAEGFSAIYIATGKDGESFGLADGLDQDSLGSRVPGVFIGGEVLGVSAVQAVEHGARVSRSIDKYLQIGAMDGIPETYAVWPVNELYYRPIPVAPPSDTGEKDGAIAEAGRCADCECSACIDVCPMLQDARRTPKKLAYDVTMTVNKIEQQTRRIANRLIHACNLCGLCAEVCPADCAIGECLQEARKAVFEQGGTPPVFHDYYLRDMDHAVSDEGYFEYLPDSEDHGGGPGYLFFTGCQIGASFPDYVLKPYEALRAAKGDAGILVTCCGAPAEWAGGAARADELLQEIRRVWEEAGKPTILCACLTCRNRIAEALPDIPAITYLEWMSRATGTGRVAGSPADSAAFYLFDPCAARYDDEAGAAARGLLAGAGVSCESGKMSGPLAECCGFGGHIYASNPGLYETVVNARLSESEKPYITYCSNCRDAFAARGKRSLHIFDLLFETDGGERPAPSVSERRQNRRIVKRKLTEICFGQRDNGSAPPLYPRMLISDELALKMERELLSAEDVGQIIGDAESGGKKLCDTESGYFIAHGAIGAYICWVVYEQADGAFRPVNLYTHRMQAMEEA